MEQREIIKVQHFLPQCYLQGFAGDNGKLQTLNLELLLEHGKIPYPREFTPAQLCYEDDFYTLGEGMETFNVKDVADKYTIEKRFHAYENKYRDLISKIEKGGVLQSDDAAFLIRIIFDLKFRNKYFRDKFIAPRQAEVVNEASDEIRELIVNDPDYLSKYEGATEAEILTLSDDIRKKLLNDPDFKKNAHLSALYRQEDGYADALNMLTPKLLHCQWVVLKSDHQFVSNDNPGCSMDKNSLIHNSYFERDFMFFIPLTSSFCLTISDAGIDMDHYNDPRYKRFPVVKAPQSMIDSSNNFAFRHFNKFVYGRDKNLLSQLAKTLQTA